MVKDSENTVTFLVVDDDDVDRELVKRTFRKLNISNPIVEAEDGSEALEKLRHGVDGQPIPKPYVVVLDLNMPRMNGFEFLDEIRSDPELRHTVVFVLTTSNTPMDKAKAYDRFISGYILKRDFQDSFMHALMMVNQFQRVIEFPE